MNAPEKLKQYDRDAQAVGNIVHLEHFNVVIDDQRLATLFYVVGLGGTRDPYIFPGLENMWVNFGRTQVHLPSRGSKPEVVRGTVGFVVPSLDELKKRLQHAEKELKRVVPEKQTKFSWQREGWRHRGHLPVGQPRALPCALAGIRTHRARPGLRRLRRAAGHRRRHRALL